MDSVEKLYILILVFTIPVCLLIRFSLTSHLRSYGCGIIGVLTTWYICNVGVHYMIAISALCLAFLPTSFAARFLPVFSFACLLPARYVYQFDGPSNAMLLILTLRVSMFGCDLTDKVVTSSSTLDLVVLKFLPYVYSLPGIFTGPIYPYTIFEKGCASDRPVPWMGITRLIAFAVLAGVVNLVLTPTFAWLKIESSSFIETLGLLCIAPLYFRARCYFAWYLTEAALTSLDCVRDGWGTNFIEPLGLEKANFMRKTVFHWNASVQGFLGKYAFGRMKTWKQRRFYTFLLAAWWHGTDVGIYIFFLGYHLAQWLESFYHHLLPTSLAWVQCQLITNWLTAAFIFKADIAGFSSMSSRTYHLVPASAALMALIGGLWTRPINTKTVD